MEDVQKLTEWVRLSKQRFRLRMHELTWPKFFGLDLFDYSISMMFQEREITGRGTAPQPTLAFIIAISELIERSAVIANSLPSSIGVAAHSSRELAASNGRREFVEHRIISESLQDGHPIQLLKKMTVRGLTIHQFLFGIRNGYHIVLSMVNGFASSNQFTLTIGSAAHEQLEVAQNRSLIEALRSAAAKMEGVGKRSFATSDVWWSEDFKDRLGQDHSFAKNFFDRMISASTRSQESGEPAKDFSLIDADIEIAGHLNVPFSVFVVRTAEAL